MIRESNEAKAEATLHKLDVINNSNRNSCLF